MAFLLKKILYLFLFFFMASAYANPAKQSVKEFLEKQEVIRILGNDFMGFGDLAASANIMQQLISFGYQGRFEFIYNGDGKNVSLLFGLPNNLPDIYDDEKSHTRFIKIQPFFHLLNDHKIKPQQIGFTTQYRDNACEYILDMDKDDALVKEKLDTIMCTNLANFSNTNTLIDVSNWPVPSIKKEGSSQSYHLDQVKSRPLDDSTTYFATPVATFQDANAFLKNNPQGRELIAKKPALKTFVEGIATHQFDVMPVYGWGFRAKWEGLTHYASNMLQIVSAARYAQLSNNDALKKPLIIAVFYNYENELAELNKLIQNDRWDEKFEGPGAAETKAEMKKLKLAEIVSTASLSDASTQDVLKDLQPGKILLLSVGSLPKTVFDGLFTHTDSNILPQFREGASTFSSLLLTGKPHFRCGNVLVGSDDGYIWEMTFRRLQDLRLKENLEKLYADNGIYCNGLYGWEKNPEGYKLLAQFINEAKLSSTAFSHYFANLKTEAEKIDNNRVYQLIDQVLKIQGQGNRNSLTAN